MRVGFVSRVTTWLRRRVPNAILIDDMDEFVGVVLGVVLGVVDDRLSLEGFDEDVCVWVKCF